MIVTRARWQQIQSLFEEVIQASPAERSDRLNQACADDAELRNSVESLLKFDASTGDPFLGAIGDAAGDLLEAHADRLIGKRVGAYRIVSVLGHGGTSTVYTAERADAKYQQTVAIKVLHHTTLHPRMRNRLHSERHILATLEHASIARLIDSGDLEDGTPYLIMEHVQGEDVFDYCDKRTLFVRERLELFVKICEAVQFAHRNLIVHRDIKAGNILVTGEGTPKLLDFGIAKLLAPESISHTLPVTRLQERVLTPENAAPEQVLGRPITTATDIYALGVLLYQLLSGRPPYRLSSYSQLQLCMDDPVRPSQAVTTRIAGESDLDRQKLSDRRGLSPERLRARLAGDLDSIVAMAMRKEPERRYASAQALAEDITRHLEAQPVLARQGDWRYNSAKFLRRHFLAVFGVAAVIVGMTAVAAVTLWQNHRIEIAREATARERDRAQRVSGFLVDVFSQADPYNAQGHDVTAKELLDRGAAKIMENLDEQPEVRAQLLESIGLAYRSQGLSERAVPLLEQALAIRRQARPVNPNQVASALANLAQALSDAGDLTSAEVYLKQALSLTQGAAQPATRQTADILMQLGALALGGRSQPDRAAAYFREALGIYRSVFGDEHLEVANALNELANVAIWKDDYVQAEKYQRDALAVFQATVSRNHPDHAVALANLGEILVQRGKYAEAESVLNEALEVEGHVFGKTHQRVAQTLESLATLYDRRGEYRRAIDTVARSIELTRTKLGPDHYLTGYRIDLLANLYLEAGNAAAAERYAREALAIYAKSLPAEHLYIASTHQLLGDVLIARGQFQAAESELKTALNLNQRLAGPDSWRAARSEASLGWAMIEERNEADGVPMLTSAQAKLMQALGAQNISTRQASKHLLEYYRAHHRDADAARILAALDTR
jgi:eukaryotic-like serine/threonine-protein kinase